MKVLLILWINNQTHQKCKTTVVRILWTLRLSTACWQSGRAMSPGTHINSRSHVTLQTSNVTPPWLSSTLVMLCIQVAEFSEQIWNYGHTKMSEYLETQWNECDSFNEQLTIITFSTQYCHCKSLKQNINYVSLGFSMGFMASYALWLD